MSFFAVTCPTCRVQMKLAAALAGKKVRCPKCETVFRANQQEATSLTKGTQGGPVSDARVSSKKKTRSRPSAQALTRPGPGMGKHLLLIVVACSVLLGAGVGWYLLNARIDPPQIAKVQERPDLVTPALNFAASASDLPNPAPIQAAPSSPPKAPPAPPKAPTATPNTMTASPKAPPAPSAVPLEKAVEPPVNLPPILGKQVKDLIANLASADPKVRHAALITLQQGGPETTWALPVLHAVLINDDNAIIRRMGAEAIGKMGPRGVAAVPGLINLLGDADEPVEVRTRCADALGRIGPEAKAAIPVLARILANPTLTADATTALARLGPDAAAALTNALKEADKETRSRIFATVAKLGPESRDLAVALAKLARQPDPELRRGALDSLGHLRVRDPGTVELGLQTLGDPEAAVRAAALAALRGQGAGATPALSQVRAALRDQAPEVRAQASLVLGEIGRAARETAGDLLDLAQDPNPQVQVAVAVALGQLGVEGERAVPVLARALAHAEPAARSRIAFRLGLYGPSSAAAVPALLKIVLTVPEPESTPAIVALGRIGTPALPAVLKLLGDSDARVQSRAAAVVQRMPPQGNAVIAPLRPLLKKPETAPVAIGALQQQGPAARPASAELAILLAANKSYSSNAAQALAAIGFDTTAAPRIEEAIRAGGHPKRYAALALGGGGPGAAELLRPLLTDADTTVRNYARNSQARIENMSRLEAKRQALKAAGDPRARFYAAADVLRLDPHDEPAALLVARELRSPDHRLRDHAVSELMSARPPSIAVLRFLIDAVQDADLDAEARIRCRRIITRMDRSTAEELGVLITDVIPPPRNPTPTANYVRLPMPARTRLRVPEESIQCGIRFLTPKEDSEDSRPVLVLERAQDLGTVKPGSFRGLLARELVRQAVLLTAREELGLLTRDLTLRETFDETPAFTLKAEFGLVMVFQTGANVRVSLVRRSGPKEPLWQKELAVPTARPFDYVCLAEAMERCAREELPAVLRQAGVMGPAPRAQAPAAQSPKRVALPDGVEEKLNGMSFLVQFAALRELDQLRRTQGQSPELLGGLVRAYANLGLLTGFHYTVMDRAYQARALLYAQRLMAVAPASPVGRWHRAYACTLVGLPAAALADLAEADRLEKARQEDGQALARPRWVDLIGSSCRFDSAALEKAGDSQLARLLGFHIIEHPSTKALTIKTGLALLQDNPECYHVIDALCPVGGVSLLHKVTLLGPAVLLQTQRLRQMPDLPGEVAAELAAGKVERLDEVQLLRVLEGAGGLEHDTAEPAWSSLAWLLRETRFVQLMRRVEFMKDRWNVPVKDFVQESLPLLADHPLQPLFALMGVQPNEAQGPIELLRQAIDPSELKLAHGPRLHAYVNRTDEEVRSQRGRLLAEQHADDIVPDLARELFQPRGDIKLLLARRLLQISPGNPVARVVLVVGDWQAVKKEAVQWQEPMVLGEMWKQLAAENRIPESQAMLKAYLQRSPEFPSYQALAESYKKEGRLDLWEATLKDFLKEEDFGLEHAQCQVLLSRHYIESKEWKKALPYAEAAAETGAAWAMLNLMVCYEGLGEWDKAEEMARATTLRYAGQEVIWFRYCVRTCRGDLPAALKAGLAAFRRSGRAPDPFLQAFDFLIEKQPQQALALVQGLKTEEPIVKLLIVLLADEVGKSDVRDSVSRSLPVNHYLGQLAALFRKALTEQGGKLDLKAVEQLLAPREKQEQSTAAFFVGRFLELHGQTEESIKYYQRCLIDPTSVEVLRGLACIFLRAQGREPNQDTRDVKKPEL